jgi:hypothetical protein
MAVRAVLTFAKRQGTLLPVVSQKSTSPNHSGKNATGNVEYDRFTNLVDQVLSVPHSVIKQRVEEHRRAVARNPHRRGPKSKKS